MVFMNQTQRQGQEVETLSSMKGIRLQPFLHQVSGRAIMMCLNENTVCKPLNSREYCFYQSLPSDILQYTPQYKGVINVNIEETKDGTIAITALPPDNEEIGLESETTSTSLHAIDKSDNEQWERVMMPVQSTEERSAQNRICVKRTGSLSIERSDDDSTENDVSAKDSRFNPWSLKVFKDGLRRHLHSKSKVVQSIRKPSRKLRMESVLSDIPAIPNVGDSQDPKVRWVVHHPHKLVYHKELLLQIADDMVMEVDDMDSESILVKQLRRYCTTKHLFTDKTNSKRYECILLENVTSRFKFPCILDLKMGTRVHGDFDDPEKRQRHLAKCAKSTTHTLGVRLAGMQVYHQESGRFLCRNKYFGRALSVDGFKKTLREFFYNGCRMRTDVINPIIDNMKSLVKRLKMLPSYRFYSSSLLIMYDGAIDTPMSDEDGGPWKSSEATISQEHDGAADSRLSENFSRLLEPSKDELGNTTVDIRMIDFAKSTHQDMDESVIHEGPDKGYIFGLESLIELLYSIANEELQ